MSDNVITQIGSGYITHLPQEKKDEIGRRFQVLLKAFMHQKCGRSYYDPEIGFALFTDCGMLLLRIDFEGVCYGTNTYFGLNEREIFVAYTK